jgi:ubiquinone/menaquinone biosynthesis C-methylase UbiE
MNDHPVGSYYDRCAQKEWERMERHRMEFLVTQRALLEYLPGENLQIADIGGGPGRYTIFLTNLGHELTLVDLSPAEIQIALDQAEKVGIKIGQTLQANALDLSSLPEAHFDAVLILGPLYHLQEEAERCQAVSQAMRILKPGGILFAAFITIFAPFRDYAATDPDTVFIERVEWLKMLQDGRNFGEGFPGAFFSHPDRLIPFMEGCGLETIKMIGVEGVVAAHEEKINLLQGKVLDFWVELNYRLGEDPACWGAANHLLYIGQKPADKNA